MKLNQQGLAGLLKEQRARAESDKKPRDLTGCYIAGSQHIRFAALWNRKDGLIEIIDRYDDSNATVCTFLVAEAELFAPLLLKATAVARKEAA